MGQRRTVADVADALLFDPDTVRGYFKRYQEGGLDRLLRMAYVGGEAFLAVAQWAELDAHLQTQLYPSAVAFARWVAQRWGVRYIPRDMTVVLHRLGYTYKKARRTPGKPDPERQEAFLEHYNTIKESKDHGDPIYFMDATHPQHNPVIGCGWIKRGEDYPIKSNTGRRRLNINGAIEIQTYSSEIRFDVTIDAASTIALVPADREGQPRRRAHRRDLRQRPLLPFQGGSGLSRRPRAFNWSSCRPTRPILTSSNASGSSSSARCSTTDTTRRSRSTRTPASSSSPGSMRMSRSYARC